MTKDRLADARAIRRAVRVETLSQFVKHAIGAWRLTHITFGNQTLAVLDTKIF